MCDLDATLARVAKNVRRLRTDRGWSQPQLANWSDISRETIVNIEIRRKPTNLKTLVAIANTFGVEVTELLK